MSDDAKFQTEDHAVEVVAAGLDALDPDRGGPTWQHRTEHVKEAWRAQARKMVRALSGGIGDGAIDAVDLVDSKEFSHRVAAEVAVRLMHGDVGQGGAGLPERIARMLDEIHEERQRDQRDKALAILRDGQEHPPIATPPGYGLYADPGPVDPRVNAGVRMAQIEAAESRGELALGDCEWDPVSSLPPSVRRDLAGTVLKAAGFYGSDLSARAVTAMQDISNELEGVGVVTTGVDPEQVTAAVRTLTERYGARVRELERTERARRRTLPLMGIGAVIGDDPDSHATYLLQQRALIDAARVNDVNPETVQAVVSTYLRSMYEMEDAGE